MLVMALIISNSQVFMPPEHARADTSAADATAAAPGCSPANDLNGTSVAHGTRCVAETMLSTRNRLAPNCFGQKELPDWGVARLRVVNRKVIPDPRTWTTSPSTWQVPRWAHDDRGK